MEWWRVIWYVLHNSTIILDLKVVALSVRSFVGHPNLDRMLVSRKAMITISMACLEGMDSVHFVK